MSNWPRCASFLVAVALAGGSALSTTAAAQEDPTEDPTIILPAVPKEVGDRLPDDPQQRHPWVPNDAPWPWNMSIVQGSWQNPNSSITPVYCGPTVASQNPYWYQENLRYTQYSGGARCNVQMQSITGTAHLLQWNGPGASTPELTSAPIGSQHAVPAGHGSGWQAYAYGYYTRTSDDQNLQIRLDVRLELPPMGPRTGRPDGTPFRTTAYATRTSASSTASSSASRSAMRHTRAQAGPRASSRQAVPKALQPATSQTANTESSQSATTYRTTSRTPIPRQPSLRSTITTTTSSTARWPRRWATGLRFRRTWPPRSAPED